MNSDLEQKILDHIDQSLIAFRASMSPEMVKQLASDVAYIKVEHFGNQFESYILLWVFGS